MTAPDTPRLTPWIAGAGVDHDGEWLDVINPVSETVVGQVANASAAVVDQAVRSADAAQDSWAARPSADRAEVLEQIADAVRRGATDLAQLDGRETGKSLDIAVEEMLGVARYFSYYAAEARTLTGDTIETGPGEHTFVQRVPFGVVGVVVPWNYAANQTARSAAPALAMGNAVVVKPSELASSAVLALAQLAHEAGLPAGLLNVVTGTGQLTGESLVEHSGVRRLSFTGSVSTGRHIAQRAAERLVPVGLELGGKSPHLVFADADLDAAARTIVEGFTAFAGQTCSAGTRVLVEGSVMPELLRRVKDLVLGLNLVDAVGPLISDRQRRAVTTAIDRAVGEGARPVTGPSTPLPATGYYVAPTVLADVTSSMRVFGEEVFGPVLTVTPFEDENEAVELANAPAYGLVGAVWTESLSRALRVASQLECGQVFVNRWGAGERVPFGGFGVSGLGREKGRSAINEYTQTRAVCIEVSEEPR